MGSHLASLAFVGLVLSPAVPAAGLDQPTPAGLSPEYATALERYVSGDRDGAVAAVATLPERALRDQVDALRSLRKRARACTECPDSIAWRRAPLAAALMLHTDCSLASGREGEAARLHESLAAALAELMKDDPDLEPFARRWFAAMVGLAQGDNRWSEALDWVERGLAAFPRSAVLLLAQGAIDETYGAEVSPRWPDVSASPLAQQTQANLDRVRELRGHLQKALTALRAALGSDPSLDEARLRLGRVSWRLGDAEQARAELLEVLARSSERATVFLAHLFLGRVHEDAERLDDAARSYEAALALYPRCQSARLALSHLLWRRGDAAGARREVEAALQPAGEGQQRDPFWQYPWGSGVGAADRLAALRLEVSS